MTRSIRLLILTIICSALGAQLLLADTLTLRSGERIPGYFEGGNSRVVNFRTSAGESRAYDVLNILQIQFGSDDRDFHSRTVENSPASLPNTYTVPSGTRIIIRLIDAVSSERQKVGEEFRAALDEPVVVDGIEIIPRGAAVRGRIVEVADARRITGSAELSLELIELTTEGVSYRIATAEFSEVGESRTGETFARAGIGAGIGAVVGAIAGGGKGAAIGAGVGAGGATAAQALTKGQKIEVPSETRLDFTLRIPLVIVRAQP